MAVKECCAKCKYWLCHKGKDGICRYRPPTVLCSSMRDQFETVWPQTQATEWCGDFAEFDEETDADHGGEAWDQ